MEASQPSADLQPPGGTELGYKVDLQRTSGVLPPLSLLFYPLTYLSASSLSASPVLASNSRPDASTLPTLAAQSWLQAYYHWLTSGG